MSFVWYFLSAVLEGTCFSFKSWWFWSLLLSWQQNTVFEFTFDFTYSETTVKDANARATTFRSFCSLTLNQCNRPRLQNSNNLMIQKSTFASLNSAWRWIWQNLAVSIYASFNCYASDFRKNTDQTLGLLVRCAWCHKVCSAWKSLGLDKLLVH